MTRKITRVTQDKAVSIFSLMGYLPALGSLFAIAFHIQRHGRLSNQVRCQQYPLAKLILIRLAYRLYVVVSGLPSTDKPQSGLVNQMENSAIVVLCLYMSQFTFPVYFLSGYAPAFHQVAHSQQTSHSSPATVIKEPLYPSLSLSS
jgi:hypothetical protein